MLVRAASPKGAEGRTFGIVSTGFNIGGVIGPIFLGYLLDQHLAKGVLWGYCYFYGFNGGCGVMARVQQQTASRYLICAVISQRGIVLL